MATTNPFDLLGDDDNDDPSQLIAAQQQKAAPAAKKGAAPAQASAQPAKQAAKLPSKPLPPAQAVREVRNEGSRGGGRGGGRGVGRGGRGRGFNRDFADNENSFGSNNGFSGGFKPQDDGESGRPSERRSYGGGPRGGYRGGRRGGFGEGEDADGERPRRAFERRSGTGRGNEFKRDGAGRGNWGSPTDEIAPEAEEAVAEKEKNVDVEKPLAPEEAGDANKDDTKNEQEEKEPEDKRSVHKSINFCKTLLQFLGNLSNQSQKNPSISAMASGRRQSEGIALLSIYGDEDEEMEDMEENQPDDIINDVRDAADNTEDVSDTVNDDKRCDSDRVIGSDSGNDGTPLQDVFNENFTPKSINFGTSTPQQQPQISLSSPPQQLGALETNRTGRGTLGIVDYGHDEVAMSPEAEEGEVTTGRVMVGEELQNAYGEFHEKTPPGTVQVLTPSTQATPLLPSEQHDMSQSDAMNYTENDLESNRVEEADLSAEEPKDIDLLDKFLPPPPKAKCPDELQEKIIKFLSFKKTTGRSFNSEVRNRKEYRNPDFLLHAVTYQDIDQIGSCFSKDVFDPHGYDKSDYYDELEADMKREMERKEQERKKSPKVDFISGAAQPGTIVPSPKLNLPIQVASGGLLPVPTSVDAVARESRQNKKSKWDKVDGGDRRHPLPPGGKDSASAAGAHAALLSAANAGTGYTAFAQQRRREAEERKSSDKKSERRT